jgi:SAM-dependent methyltransferase
MNTERFTGRAELYDSYRPKYPDSMYDYICGKIMNTVGVIADIGAGTGILSAGFLKRGNTVYCVEPNRDMRTILENRFRHFNGFVSTSGTADNTLLKDDSIKLVTAAQAFHWFDTVAFSAECRRILCRGGNVAVIYNKRNESSPFIQELTSLRERSVPSPVKNEPFKEALGTFFKGGYNFETFENNLTVDLDSFVGNMLSSSTAPLKGEAGYQEYVRELKQLFGKYENGGHIVIPYNTNIYHSVFKAANP